MKLLDAIIRRFPAPRLTATRIVLAFAVALTADAVQVALLPLGPIGLVPDEAIDVAVMILTCWILGFHILLLPTFVIEFIPVIGMLPTWTGCVAAVVALRRAEQSAQPPPAAVPPPPVLPAPPRQLPEASTTPPGSGEPGAGRPGVS